MNVLRHFSRTYRLYKKQNEKTKNRIKPKQRENKKKTKKCLLKRCLTRLGPIVYVVPRDSLI